MKKLALSVVLVFLSFSARAASLSVVKAGPVGETDSIAEANEVRVIFSEPMVKVGKSPTTAPWFHIAPEVRGTIRWSGTTTLIFTPEPRLPFATKYDVTIDDTVKSVAGSKLDRAYAFSFTTPTIKLLRTDWYRRDGKADGAVVIAIWFNQPIDAATLVQHLQLRTRTHDWTAPLFTPDGRKRLETLEPQALGAFEAKRTRSQQAAASDGAPVLSFATTDWDRKRWPAVPEMVVMETKPGVSPDTTIQLMIDGELASTPANVRTGRTQEVSVELAPAFFVEKVSCFDACNPESRIEIEFRSRAGVHYENLRGALSVVDITDPAHEVPLTPAAKKSEEFDPNSSEYSLDDLGYSVTPAHDYALRIDPSLQSSDGQTLGYAWMTVVHFMHKSGFISFGGGHGVWESAGGTTLPFYARNVKNVQQWLAPLPLESVMPTILLQGNDYSTPPATAPSDRNLAPAADKIQSYGVNLKPLLGTDGKGLAWVAIKQGNTIPKSSPAYDENLTRATLVQVTNLGINVKDSPLNTLVFVTRLDDAAPVAGARVSIRKLDNSVFWTGTTDVNGLVTAPNTDLRVDRTAKKKKPASGGADAGEDSGWEDNWSALDKLHFIVTAEKDGDVAYVASDWHDGVSPWDFDLSFNLGEAEPLLRGTVFSDRGVYKLGEDVHLKAVLRSDTPKGMQLLPAGTRVDVVIQDSHDKEVDKRTIALNDWSSAEFIFKVPADGSLGTYQLRARVEGQRLQTFGDFLVAAYRRPDFRVDATLSAKSSVTGTNLDGRIAGRYLFGGAMSSRPVTWTLARYPLSEVPEKIADRWPAERWVFLSWPDTTSWETVASKDQKLNSKGDLVLSLPTAADAGMPYNYRLQGEVTDVSRQKIAGNATYRVDPAHWYIGISKPPYFADSDKGVDTQIVAVGMNGAPVAGVSVNVTLTQIQWNSVRQAEGNGMYAWETERKEVPAGEWTITTTEQPAPLHLPIANGGYFVLKAKASDSEGHSTSTKSEFYAVGGGYTAWERYDHNRIDLVPESQTWKPGDTARIMVKSPWEHATALVTTEREGVRTSKPFTLTSTQQTISVPITEKDIPNVFVSVLLVKGRTKEGIEDSSDPGKPSFRLGYVELTVRDASKRLAVTVKANRQEYRPATKAKIEVNVHDARGKGAVSEVTLWAVDYGVLSLTGYKTPDVLDWIYLRKALQVANEDSRQRIISRRVLTPKGATDGGGGGRDAGPGMVRKDFRVLAFWVGSITTDASGNAHTEITLPESLTTYRIMAVAGDRQSRFGWGQNEIRINKPLLLTATYPRFLAVGDKALFGAVVHNQLKQGGQATVTIKSLDPTVLSLTGDTTSTVDVGAGGSVEARFHAAAQAVGDARVQMTVAMSGETDAFEDTIPVRVLLSPETYAAYGDVGGAPNAPATGSETLAVPEDVVPGFGGLHVDLSSTAMVGLGEGAGYLVTYPYGCAEQRSSAALALMLVSDLGDAFKLPAIEPARLHATAQATLNELPKFQCGDGGFSFWAGECWSTSPYLTSYVLHVYQRGQKLGYTTDKAVLDRAYKYLEQKLGEKKPANEGWMPSYTAWQAFAVKVLVEGGRNEDSHLNRLMKYVDQMPLFGIAHLADALNAKGEKSPRLEDLRRRLTNAILPEGGYAHVGELNDPYLLWFWNSNIRSTAIVTGSLVRGGSDPELVKRLVRWLMKVRQSGRWGSTQENAWAMESLVDYYRKYESETPDFTAAVTLGTTTLATDTFRGRSTEAKSHDVPIVKLEPGHDVPVKFDRTGTGTLFYAMRLKFARSAVLHDSLDQGFAVTRKYSVGSGAAATSFKAGDLIKVTLNIRNTKERRFVAITDPIPAGTEPVESWFATTATELSEQQQQQERGQSGWMWWERGGFDHVERHDDRVDLFATRLGTGPHEFSYMIRATTAGTFVTAPMHAEEMYEPEVFGRTASAIVEVKP